MSADLKPDEDEMSLVQERYEEIDDQPIEDDNLSVFNEEELKSHDYQNMRDCPRSIDFDRDKHDDFSKHRNIHFGGLSTIKEVNESRANLSNISNLRPRNMVQVKEKQIETANDQMMRKADDSWGQIGRNNFEKENFDDTNMSFQFGNAADVINQYEEHFLSDKNKADRMFPEDDIRFRGEPHFFEKENSWEPSCTDWQKRESPVVAATKSPSLNSSRERKIPENVFENLSISNGTTSHIKNTNKETLEIMTQTTPKTPDREFPNGFGTPKARRSHHTSTPKGAEGYPRRPSQLEDTRISSIHGDSPSRAHFFNSPSNTTVTSNMTVDQSQVKAALQNGNGDLRKHLEGIRKMRPSSTVKPNFAKKVISRPDHSTLQTALETSKVDMNILKEKEPAKFSLSRNWTTDFKKNEKDDPRVLSKENMRQEEEWAKMDMKNRRESANSIRSSSRASTSSSTSTTSRPDKNIIRMSCRRMAFGAVEIGDKMTMELDVENISDRQINIITSIDSSSPAFEIIDNHIRGIMPGHKNTVRVAFSPTSGGRYQVMLKIFVQTMNLSFFLPIWGCGGVVKIEPIGQDISLSNTNDFVLRTSNYSKLMFTLKNDGCRDGFARIDVYDGLMKPVKCRIGPSHALMIKRRSQAAVEILLDEMLTTIAESRSSSSLSSRPSSSLSLAFSRGSSRRSTMTGADLIVEIKWGEELFRQRLKMLEKQSGRWVDIDGHDFTRCRFVGEQEFRPKEGFPKVFPEDKDLFVTSYRTTNLMVFSVRPSSRYSNGYRSTSVSLDPSETILETTAFRHQTFVPDLDATVVPKR